MKVKDMFIEFINKTESIISTMDEDMRILSGYLQKYHAQWELYCCVWVRYSV